MISKVLTKQEIEDRLDQITKNPERFIRDEKGNKIEAITSSVYSIGKTVTLVEPGNVDETFRHYALNAPVADVDNHKLPNVTDRFRAATGRFWTDQDPTRDTFLPDTNNLVYLKKEHPAVGAIKISFDVDMGTGYEVEAPYGATLKWYMIEPIRDRFRTANGNFSPAMFKKYLEGGTHNGKSYSAIIEPDKWFYDHAVDIRTPFERRDIDRLNSNLRTMYAHIEPQYNFYLKGLESIMSSMNSKETIFPNMYVFFAQKAAKEKFDEDTASGLSPTPPNPIFEKHITLGGSLKEETSAAMSLPYDERPDFRLDDPAGQYFDIWANSYSQVKDSTKRILNDKFKNVFFPLGDMKLLADSNRQQYLFPMYASIEFSTDVTTEFGEILRQTQMSSVLLSDIFEKTNSMPSVNMFQAIRTTVLARTENAPHTPSVNIARTHYARGNRRYFDIEGWLERMKELQGPDASGQLFDGYDSQKSIFIGAYANEKKVGQDPQYTFWKSLMSVIFAGKLRKTITQNQRTFKEIMDGKPAYHETVCYRVSKYKGDVSSNPAAATPIQNFFFPNSNEIDVLKFVDTQVKYDQTYTYVVYAYEFIVGSKYRYSDPVTQSGNASVQVRVQPSLRLMEVPYYQKVIRMVDSPPIHPDVEFVPYRSVNNRVRIQMNGNVGEYKMVPQIINDNDIQQNAKFFTAQDRVPGEELEYSSDDHPAAFEVWRIDRRPRQYSDFAGHLIKRVRTGDGGYAASSATFIDKIKPNKKYYYTFRSEDIHGNISHPTTIYEYEMVDDAGSIYPLMRIVGLESVSPRTPTKSAKRYVRVFPSLENTVVDTEQLEEIRSGKDVSDAPLGIEKDPAWGKKFKIRITSRSTGKKFDLNVSFKSKHTKHRKTTKGGR